MIFSIYQDYAMIKFKLGGLFLKIRYVTYVLSVDPVMLMNGCRG